MELIPAADGSISNRSSQKIAFLYSRFDQKSFGGPPTSRCSSGCVAPRPLDREPRRGHERELRGAHGMHGVGGGRVAVEDDDPGLLAHHEPAV